MIKTYSYTRMRRGFHCITWFTGMKFHRDGSPAADIEICTSERAAKKVITRLQSEGYKPD